MAQQSFFPISELSTYHPKWLIRARVTQKSQMRTFASKREAGGQTQVFDCHLLDESGVEISATFFGGVAEKYFPMLQQGKCFTFSRGSVRIANRQFNRGPHRYQLSFDSDALIEEAAEVADIKTVSYSFTDLHAVQSKALPCNGLDLVGIVTAARPTATVKSKDGQDLVKREITIADDTSTSMTVTLWGDRASKEDKAFEGHPAICLKGVALREWNGGRSGSLSENGVMELRPSLPEAQRLQLWWSQHGSTASLTSITSASLRQEGLVDLRTLQSKSLPCTVDLCGIITSFKPTFAFTSQTGKELVKREITIADATACSMGVTLWGERAKQDGKFFDDHAVVCLRGVIVKEWNGGRSGSLLEAGDLIFQPSTPDAQRIREWWSQQGSTASLTSMTSTSLRQEGLVDLRTLQSKSLPCTVDLCGIITSFKPTFAFTSQTGKELVKREITIADATACSMGVTLWGERAKQDDKLFDDHVVVCLKGVTVKEWNGGRSGSLLEAGDLVFQPSMPEAQHIREWWSQGGAGQSVTALSLEGAGAGGAAKAPAQICTVTEMRQAAEQVSGSQPVSFGMVCRLASVQMRKQGDAQPLYYLACQEAKAGSTLPCNKRLGEDGFCAACNRAGKAALRLNIRCRFSDCSDSAWLATFHEPALRVLTTAAEDLKALEVGEGGREALEAAVRRQYFAQPFQVTVRAKLDSYNGEPRANVTCVDARPVNRGVHGRAMLKGIKEMLGSEPVAAF